ncbi:MAG: hypothetical protein NC310_06225 [Roseburia sp.]|nr:hypothetical protein [Anaeroplasma bactoclasticum]MCM1196646.1 hypothetical protein [Roseburia sp.]MCM1557530.1 hypothetical protein [Anaeroplasma bactoclasticum]
MKRIRLVLFLSLLFPLFASFQANAKDKDSYTHVHIIDYDHPLSFDEIKARYSSYDSIDGDLTDQIHFKSNYEADYINNTLAVKSYELNVTVTNSRNVTVQWTDEISVRDFTAPILSFEANEIFIDIATENVKSILTQSLIVKDNWDTSFEDYEIKGLEITNLEPGTYPISCTVRDSSKNVSNEVNIIIHIKKSFEKQISSNSIYIENSKLTDDELLALFLQKNSVDTSYKTVQVESSYFQTPEKEGIYQAEFIFDYEDGIKKIYQCKIINTLPEVKKKDDKIIYISLGCISILACIGIFIYRKRR